MNDPQKARFVKSIAKEVVGKDRVEIKGTIPSQVLYRGEESESETGLVITSPSPYQGEGESNFLEGLCPS